jgi:hypothetical protein
MALKKCLSVIHAKAPVSVAARKHQVPNQSRHGIGSGVTASRIETLEAHAAVKAARARSRSGAAR